MTSATRMVAMRKRYAENGLARVDKWVPAAIKPAIVAFIEQAISEHTERPE